jgi:hypothetical protein
MAGNPGIGTGGTRTAREGTAALSLGKPPTTGIGSPRAIEGRPTEVTGGMASASAITAALSLGIPPTVGIGRAGAMLGKFNGGTGGIMVGTPGIAKVHLLIALSDTES